MYWCLDEDQSVRHSEPRCDREFIHRVAQTERLQSIVCWPFQQGQSVLGCLDEGEGRKNDSQHDESAAHDQVDRRRKARAVKEEEIETRVVAG
jgi:hypothetical protein